MICNTADGCCSLCHSLWRSTVCLAWTHKSSYVHQPRPWQALLRTLRKCVDCGRYHITIYITSQRDPTLKMEPPSKNVEHRAHQTHSDRANIPQNTLYTNSSITDSLPLSV